MSIVLSLIMMSDAAWKWIGRLGGPGFILLGLSDNTPFISAPPGSVDVCVILACGAPAWSGGPITPSWLQWERCLAGYLTYRLAEKGGERTLEKKVGKPRAEAVYKGFERFGSITVLGGALLPPPFPFTTVLMTAGVMQYPRKKFLSALIAGRGLRFFAVAYLGRTYGHQMISFFSRHYRTAMVVLIAIAIAAGIGALIYFLWYRPRRGHGRRVKWTPSRK